jgi:hypothetical protein
MTKNLMLTRRGWKPRSRHISKKRGQWYESGCWLPTEKSEIELRTELGSRIR